MNPVLAFGLIFGAIFVFWRWIAALLVLAMILAIFGAMSENSNRAAANLPHPLVLRANLIEEGHTFSRPNRFGVTLTNRNAIAITKIDLSCQLRVDRASTETSTHRVRIEPGESRTMHFGGGRGGEYTWCRISAVDAT